MNKSNQLVFALLVILIGAWLRFHALAQDIRLQPDEAGFSTYAREAALNGGWWLSGPLDKPPLAIYASALAQVLAGDSEFAVRLPGTLTAILLMPVMYATARAWYPQIARQTPHTMQLPLIVLILTAFSPYALAYSATAYTDALMLFCMAVALLLAGRSQWGWSGFWLGLSFASKLQGLAFLPLIPLLGWAAGQLTLRHLLLFLSGLGSVLLLLWLWDMARPEDSLMALAVVNNDPGRLLRSDEIWPQLQAWTQYGQALLGPGILTVLLVMNGCGVLAVRVLREARQHSTIVDLMLLNFSIAFVLVHWLLALNTFDRYLLPLLPPVILLAARGIEYLSQVIQPTARYIWLLPAALCLVLAPAALDTAEGRSGVNQLYHQYVGIDELAAYLNSRPVATVIYDHWLGWELRYYMGQWHDKRIVYYPNPAALVDDALALCEIGPRYLPAPIQQPVGPWLEALENAGFTTEITYQSGLFIVYRLNPPWQSTDECS